MDSFERKKGIWWLPEDPENTYYGALSFDPINGGRLEAMKLSNRNGLFNELFFGQKSGEEIDIIHGNVHGSPVTLRICYVINLKYMHSGFSEAQILVNYIYIGHHFDKVEDIVFENLSLSYTHLDEWTDRVYFSEVNPPENRLHTTSYIPFDPIKIRLDKCDIEFWGSYYSKRSKTEVSLKNTDSITITLKEKNHFDDYLKFIDFHLPNFLTLATGHANYPFNIRGIISDGRPSCIYYLIPGYEDKPRLNSYMMLFTFKDVEAHLETCLSNWISKSEELWPVYDEYFKHYYSRYIDPKSQFLSYTRALEAYHRNICDGFYLNAEAYKPIKEKLVKTIGDLNIKESHKDRLKGMVEYGHEFSLRKRIKTLCDDTLSDYKEIIEELLGKSNDFAGKVSETRNDLTHNPKDRPKNAILNNEELYKYIRRMQMLLRLCFLVEMELPPDKIKQLIKRQ